MKLKTRVSLRAILAFLFAIQIVVSGTVSASESSRRGSITSFNSSSLEDAANDRLSTIAEGSSYAGEAIPYRTGDGGASVILANFHGDHATPDSVIHSNSSDDDNRHPCNCSRSSCVAGGVCGFCGGLVVGGVLGGGIAALALTKGLQEVKNLVLSALDQVASLKSLLSGLPTDVATSVGTTLQSSLAPVEGQLTTLTTASQQVVAGVSGLTALQAQLQACQTLSAGQLSQLQCVVSEPLCSILCQNGVETCSGLPLP